MEKSCLYPSFSDVLHLIKQRKGRGKEEEEIGERRRRRRRQWHCD